ncbi:MAG: efflux transporter outer membrane subunit [Magnetococcales bacterium]|nr:efflux transporter outer membrane subunit [Magnetococcales bacterium]
MPTFFHFLFSLMILLGLEGCILMGPDYRRPEEKMPRGNWQAALPHDGSRENMTQWWGRFEDETLNRLLAATLDHHPGLEGAWAAIEIARAGLVVQEAGGTVKTELAASATRSGNHGNSPQTYEMSTAASVVDATWEIDLFGRIRRASESASAKVAARTADWHGLRVSLAAEVATTYVEWRGCMRLLDSLAHERTSREQTLASTLRAVEGGLVAPSDGDLARAALDESRSQWTLQQATCDMAIKSIVVLSGLEENEVRHLLKANTQLWPKIAPFAVTTLPARLLSQRPDLVATEEELVAANAEIGVAEASRYPRLSLLGSIGVGSVALGTNTLDNQPWSFGPALSLPLLDGGVRDANVRSARGRWNMALANYRQAVLNAVREVENALVNLSGTRQRLQDTRSAAHGYASFLAASEKNWKTGGISLLNLEEARRRSLGAERQVIQLEKLEIQQWINLYKALGGGWDPESIVAPTSRRA